MELEADILNALLKTLNIDEALKKRTTEYKKTFIPMISKGFVDVNFIAGQNPFSSKEIAQVVIQQLRK